MKKKFYQNEKFQGYFFPILYFVLSISIVVTACIIFKNKYYTPILVDGVSMKPTLVGGTLYKNDGEKTIYYRSHYGVADLHPSAVNNLKRFDVCVTHYPTTWVSDEKASIIKRVWGFPGETLDMSYNEEDRAYTFTVSKGQKEIYRVTAPIVEITRKYEGEYTINKKTTYVTITDTYNAAEFKVGNKIFYTNTAERRTFHKTLQSNEYFVMGDNWGNSTDSYKQISSSDLLTKKYLQGRAIYIDGYATASGDNAINIHKIKARYNF